MMMSAIDHSSTHSEMIKVMNVQMNNFEAIGYIDVVYFNTVK